MNYVDCITSLLCIESCNNYLCDNETYNKCSNILYNADVVDSILQYKNKRPSLSGLKKKVYNKSSIILGDVDLMVNYMNFKEFRLYKDNISLIEEKKKSISAFDIPTKLDMRTVTAFYTYGDLKSLPVIIESIYLNNNKFGDNIIAECNYIHEIGHALSQRKKKTVRNYMHCEFIPITLELLYAYINGGDHTISEYVIERISSFKKDPDPSIIKDCYNISQLLGFQAIEKYIDFNNLDLEIA